MKKIFICAGIVALMCCSTATTMAQEFEIDWKSVSDPLKNVLYKAQQDMNDGRYEAAIKRLADFQKRRGNTSDHFLIEFNIGTAYGLLGQFDEAIVHLQRATEFEDRYAPLWFNLGKLYYQDQRFLEAAHALERGFRAAARKDPEVLFMIMASFYQADALAEAIRVGEELVGVYARETTQVVSLLANAYITTGDTAGAIDMLTRMLGRSPDNNQIWKLLTKAYFKDQQFEKAAIAYEIYGYLTPLQRDELMIMGDLFSMVGVPARAAHYYTQALQGGGAAEEFEKISVAYYSAYEFDQALAAIDAALEEKTTPERLLLKAQLYYLQDEFTQAQQMYVQAAEIMTRDGHEWLMAGYCAMRSGDIKIARELLERASDFPTQRQEALNMIRMMTPVEEVHELMAALREQEKLVIN